MASDAKLRAGRQPGFGDGGAERAHLAKLQKKGGAGGAGQSWRKTRSFRRSWRGRHDLGAFGGAALKDGDLLSRQTLDAAGRPSPG